MFNLLPKPEKDAVRREYRVRLATVILWFLSAALVIGSLLLLPSWFLSAQKEAAAESRFDALERSVGRRESADLEGDLLALATQVQSLSREAPPGLFYELIGAVVSRRPKGVSLESIAVTDRGEGKHTVTVAGVAADRDALVSFSRALGEIPLLERAKLPLSNLAKESGIPFSLSAAVSF